MPVIKAEMLFPYLVYIPSSFIVKVCSNWTYAEQVYDSCYISVVSLQIETSHSGGSDQVSVPVESKSCALEYKRMRSKFRTELRYINGEENIC